MSRARATSKLPRGKGKVVNSLFEPDSPENLVMHYFLRGGCDERVAFKLLVDEHGLSLALCGEFLLLAAKEIRTKEQAVWRQDLVTHNNAHEHLG